jgi:hypothetical protein
MEYKPGIIHFSDIVEERVDTPSKLEALAISLRPPTTAKIATDRVAPLLGLGYYAKDAGYESYKSVAFPRKKKTVVAEKYRARTLLASLVRLANVYHCIFVQLPEFEDDAGLIKCENVIIGYALDDSLVDLEIAQGSVFLLYLKLPIYNGHKAKSDPLPEQYLYDILYTLDVLKVDCCLYASYKPQTQWAEESTYMEIVKADSDWVRKTRPLIEYAKQCIAEFRVPSYYYKNVYQKIQEIKSNLFYVVFIQQLRI